MRTAIIFIVGMASGIGLLFLGLFIWAETRDWLPYQPPDAKLAAHIDAMAASNIHDWNGKPLQIEKYRRWYVQGEQNGHQMIWGNWDIPDPAKYSPGIALGHRRFPPGFIEMFGGGCGQVMVIYDFTRPDDVTAVCNAPE